MPRALPWLVKANAGSDNNDSLPQESPKPVASKTSRKRQRLNTPTDVVAKEILRSPCRSTLSRNDKHSRTPSTSPPPAAPKEELMRNGDERWRMVEAELYSVAQSFTQHLHFAEYQRLKKEAALRDNVVDISLARPVTDGPQSMQTAIKIGRDAHEESITRDLEKLRAKSGVTGNGSSDISTTDDENQTQFDDRVLAGLMAEPDRASTKVQIRLGPLVSAQKPQTRAAAGFGRQVSTQCASQRLSSKSADLMDPVGGEDSGLKLSDPEEPLEYALDHTQRARPPHRTAAPKQNKFMSIVANMNSADIEPPGFTEHLVDHDSPTLSGALSKRPKAPARHSASSDESDDYVTRRKPRPGLAEWRRAKRLQKGSASHPEL